MIKVTKRSLLSTKLHIMEIPLSEKEYIKGSKRMLQGEFIQDVFPKLSSDHREFLLTGITPEEWEKIYDGDEDEG